METVTVIVTVLIGKVLIIAIFLIVHQGYFILIHVLQIVIMHMLQVLLIKVQKIMLMVHFQLVVEQYQMVQQVVKVLTI